jgi:sugar lactone lactonase YvrE
MTSIEVYSRGSDCIGEGPLWSIAERALYWIDIGRRRIYRKEPTGSELRSWMLPEYPGCMAELAANKIAVAMGKGVQALNLESGTIELLCAGRDRRPGTRFNDGKVDPIGRLWAGTMQNNFAPDGTEVPIDRFDGALYRFDVDGTVATVEADVGIANTLAWSPDLTRFYFGDSLKGVIFIYDFDAVSGAVFNKRTFFDAKGFGVPDGSAMDVDGCLWNVRWDGGALLRITPEGKVDQVIQLAVPRPTSCAFGGEDLKTLFVTSATNGLTPAQIAQAPLSGSVFAIHGVGQGLPVPPMTFKGALRASADVE